MLNNQLMTFHQTQKMEVNFLKFKKKKKKKNRLNKIRMIFKLFHINQRQQNPYQKLIIQIFTNKLTILLLNNKVKLINLFLVINLYLIQKIRKMKQMKIFFQKRKMIIKLFVNKSGIFRLRKNRPIQQKLDRKIMKNQLILNKMIRKINNLRE